MNGGCEGFSTESLAIYSHFGDEIDECHYCYHSLHSQCSAAIFIDRDVALEKKTLNPKRYSVGDYDQDFVVRLLSLVLLTSCSVFTALCTRGADASLRSYRYYVLPYLLLLWWSDGIHSCRGGRIYCGHVRWLQVVVDFGGGGNLMHAISLSYLTGFFLFYSFCLVASPAFSCKKL
jgi:hypothetical protein